MPAATTAPAIAIRVADDRPALRVERLGPGFGAVVHDVDLAALDDARVRGIQRALVDHKVLFFRGQSLTDDVQVAFASRLGELTAGHPVAESAPGRAEIYRIDSSDPEFSFSDVWHTDVTFVATPPAASVLRAVTLPDTGGDTSWADTQLAYESLSAPVRRLVDDLVAVHDGNREWGAYLRRRAGRGNEWDGERSPSSPRWSTPSCASTRRPAARACSSTRVHLARGRRLRRESRGILDLLYAHLTRPEHTIRHRWAPGDVGIWDNRARRTTRTTTTPARGSWPGSPSAATAPTGRRHAAHRVTPRLTTTPPPPAHPAT